MLNVFRAPHGASQTRAPSRGRLLATTALPVAAALMLVGSPGEAQAQQVVDGPPAVTKSVDEAIIGNLVVGQTLPDSQLLINNDAIVTVTGSTFVGNSADSSGLMTIEGGAELTGQFSGIGRLSGSVGAVTVTGPGSTWTTNAQLYIGWTGAGSLLVQAGGTVTGSGYDIIGVNTGSVGQMTVTGAGSSWTDSTHFRVGYSGAASLTVSDGGLFRVTGVEGTIYIAEQPGSSGVLNIGAATGDPAVAAGAVEAAAVQFGLGTGSLNFNHSSVYSFDSQIMGLGAINVAAGVTSLTADSSAFTGATSVSGGMLMVEGALGGTVSVGSSGTLGGSGVIGDDVTVADGGVITPGSSSGVLMILGDLALSQGSILSYELDEPDVLGGSSDLIFVGGDLTLDGVLEIADLGQFGVGVYRLIDYGGALTDNGLEIGTTPSGFLGSDMEVQVSVANQVNLAITQTVVGPLLFWDGADAGLHDNDAVNGGDGVWDAVNGNWTNPSGTANAAMSPQPGFAIFQAAPGTVTVDDSLGTVGVTGIQFAVDGYRVEGDAITLALAETVVRVGDGTVGGADFIATLTSELTGIGGLVKSDHGVLILTGANSYTGGTRVDAGTLVGDTVSLRGDIANDGRVVFQQSFDGTYADLWSGSGVFEKTGSGTLTLTGLSGDFAGETFIDNGILIVNGALGGALTIGANGRLEGSGALGVVLIADDAVIAPGNSIGTLTVNGDIVFAAGATYEVETDPLSTDSDLIHATGTATINGGTVAHIGMDGAYAPFRTYTILTADAGVTGTFDALASDYAFLDPELTYDANNVFLTLVRNDITFAGVGQTPNQIAAGGGVESLAYGDPVWDAVVMLNVDEARGAFDSLSGEVHPSMRGALIEDGARLRQALVGHLHRDRIAEGVNLWAEAYGATARIDGDGNAIGLDREGRGLFVGADAVFGPWRLGVAAGASDMAVDLDRASSADSESRHLSAYGDARWGALALRFGAARSWHEVATDRTVVFPGFSEAAGADYDAASTQAFVEAGWRMDAGTASLEPFANLARLTLEVDSFMEDGGAAALAGEDQSDSATFTTLGLRAAQRFAPNAGGTATLHGSAGWRHAAGDFAPEGRHGFDGAGDAFTVYGVPIAEDALVVQAGLDVALSDRIVIGAAYSGQMGDGVRDHALRGRASWRF